MNELRSHLRHWPPFLDKAHLDFLDAEVGRNNIDRIYWAINIGLEEKFPELQGERAKRVVVWWLRLRDLEESEAQAGEKIA